MEDPMPKPPQAYGKLQDIKGLASPQSSPVRCLPGGAGLRSAAACALAQYACRRGQSALYLRAPRLAEELRIQHGNGGFSRWLATVARTEVLILDDWAWPRSMDPRAQTCWKSSATAPAGAPPS